MGRCEIVEALLGARASPNSVSVHTAAEGDTEGADDAHPPLYLALTKGRHDVAHLLLGAGAKVSQPEPVRRQTALHAACSTDLPLELVEVLLGAWRREHATLHADEQLDDLDDAPSAAASFDDLRRPSTDDLELPMPSTDSLSAPPLPEDSEGCTPLHSACSCGHAHLARLLLRRSCAASELSRASAKRVTPLAAACRRRHAEVARMLVCEFGARLDPTAVHLCATKGEVELLSELLTAVGNGGAGGEGGGDGGGDGGIDVRFADTGVSALMLAAESGNSDVVSTLLSMGAAANAADRDGHTPLMRAAFMGHAKLVRPLVDAGAVVDAVDAGGNSAMHHAGRGGQEQLFDMLEMRYDADAERRNAEGEVPTLSDEPPRCRMQ